MKLSYHPPKGGSAGYWYAVTDDGGYDGDGPTPMDAVCALVLSLEEEADG